MYAYNTPCHVLLLYKLTAEKHPPGLPNAKQHAPEQTEGQLGQHEVLDVEVGREEGRQQGSHQLTEAGTADDARVPCLTQA